MISSSPISTSRRKLSLFILLALLSLPLWSAGYRTLAISNDEGYLALLSSSLSLLSGDVTAEDAVTAFHEAAERDAVYLKDRTLSGYRTSESFSSIESYEEPEESDDETVVLEIAEVELTENERSYLLSGDRDATEYVRLSKDLDLIIAADVTEEGLMSHAVVYANGDPVHDAMYVSSDEADEFLSLSEAILPWSKPDMKQTHLYSMMQYPSCILRRRPFPDGVCPPYHAACPSRVRHLLSSGHSQADGPAPFSRF